MTKFEAVTKQFEDAAARLAEALAAPKSDIVRDSAILRFAFTLDLAWKSVKSFLEDQKGVLCTSPKECFRAAYQQGLVEYDNAWIALVDLRNEIVHTYHKETAEKIYAELPGALKRFTALLAAFKRR